jgi:hypothetical protein
MEYWSNADGIDLLETRYKYYEGEHRYPIRRVKDVHLEICI